MSTTTTTTTSFDSGAATQAAIRLAKARQASIKQRARALADRNSRPWDFDPQYYADPRARDIGSFIRYGGPHNDMITEAAFHQEQVAKQASAMGPDVFAAALATIKTNPRVSPEMATALATVARTSGVTADDPIGAALMRASDEYQAQNPKGDGAPQLSPQSRAQQENDGLLAQVVQPLVRNAFTLLQTPIEALTGGLRNEAAILTDDAPLLDRATAMAATLSPTALFTDTTTPSGERLPSPIEQTEGGQLIHEFTQKGFGVDTGSGWFLGPKTAAFDRAENARLTAYDMGGYSWTVGRGVAAATGLDQDSLEWNVLSGVLDAGVALFADPTLVGAKVAAPAKAIEAAARAAEAASVGRAGTRAGEAVAVAERSAAADKALAAARSELIAHRVARLDNDRMVEATVSDRFREPLARAHSDALSRHADAQDTQAFATRRIRRAGAEVTAKNRIRRGTAGADDDFRLGWAANDLRDSLGGEEALDAHTAKLLDEQPDLPGVITDDLQLPAGEHGDPTLAPAQVDGVDGISTHSHTGDLRTVDVNDPIPNPDQISRDMHRALGRTKGRAAYLRSYEEVATDPSSSIGDLIGWAQRAGLTGPLKKALDASEVDAVTGVGRVVGKTESGVWWTNAEHEGLKWTDAGYTRGSKDFRASSAQARTAAADVVATKRDLDAFDARASKAKVVTDVMYEERRRLVHAYVRSADEATLLRTSMADAISDGRLDIAGRPTWDSEAASAFLTGRSDAFSARVTARLGPANVAYIRGARALEAVTSMGTSEMARLLHNGRFGAAARDKILDGLAKVDDIGLIHQLTKGKLPVDTMIALRDSETRADVLQALAPALGRDLTGPLNARGVAGRFRTGYVGSPDRNAFWQRFGDGLTKWLSPGPQMGAYIDLSRPEKTAQMLREYMVSAGMDTKSLNRHVGEVLTAETQSGRATAVMAAFDGLKDVLTDQLTRRHFVSADRAKLMGDRLHDATRLYQDAQEATQRYLLNGQSQDNLVGFMVAGGKRVKLHGPTMDSELAHGRVALPNFAEVVRASSRWATAMAKHPDIASVVENLSDTMMNTWRFAALFRFGYTMRNIADSQIRMFLLGEPNVFSNPISHTMMMMTMNPRQGRFGKLAERFDRMDRNILGGRFDPTDDAHLTRADLADLDDSVMALREYGSHMGARMNPLDVRRAVGGVGEVRLLYPGNRGYNVGWADRLLTVRAGRIEQLLAGAHPRAVRDEIVAGASREDAIIHYLQSPAGDHLLAPLREARNELADLVIEETGLRSYLFGEGGVDEGIRATTQGIPELTDFVAHGRLKHPEGTYTMTLPQDPLDAQQIVANRSKDVGRLLGKHYLKRLDPSKGLDVRRYRSTFGKDTKALERFANGYFHWNGQIEAAASMNPEFVYHYWERVATYVAAADPAARTRILAAADTQLKGVGIGAKARTLRATIHRNAKLGDAEGLTIEDVNSMAGQQAADHVKELFYDASRRRRIFHSSRLLFPFAAAQYNTIGTWGKLAVSNPVRIERAALLAHGLSQPGSATIYDVAQQFDPFGGQYDRGNVDPSEGFFYHDPQSGQAQFMIPLVGSALGRLIGAIPGQPLGSGDQLAESSTLKVPVSALNVAFTGKMDWLPSTGPVLSVPASFLPDNDWNTGAMAWMHQYIFPYGEPDTPGGDIGSFAVNAGIVPGWARRMFGALTGVGGEQMRASSMTGAMSYLLSTKPYPGLEDDPTVQQQLKDEADGLARGLTLVRAFGQAALPASPQQEFFTQDKNGDLMALSYLGSVWNQYSDQKLPFDEKVRKFVGMFGETALSGIIPSTRGEQALSTPAFNHLMNDPDLRGFTDVLSEFYPGDFSQEAFNWQKNQRGRIALTPEEREDYVLNYLHKARLVAMQGRAATEGWTTDQVNAATDAIDEQFGNDVPAIPGQTLGGDAHSRIDHIRNALTHSETLSSSHGGEGAHALLESYDHWQAVSKENNGGGLASQDAEWERSQFLAEAQEIGDKYGTTRQDDPEGGVDNLLPLFERAVTPRS